MENCDRAVSAPRAWRRESLWIIGALVLAAVLPIGNTAFAKGTNFRVVYANVDGVAELEAGNIERGIAILEAQLRNPDAAASSDVWATLCGAYIMSQTLDRAAEACDEAVANGPGFAALNNRGVLRAYRRNFDGAREDFDRARPLQLEEYLQELMSRDVRLVAADNYRLISEVLARRDSRRSTVASRTAEIEDPVAKLR